MSISSGWTNELSNSTTVISELLKDVDKSFLNIKPNHHTWSLAQILDHLIKIDESYYLTLHELKLGSYKSHWLGNFDFMTNLLGNFILKSVLPETPKKIRTLPIWEPITSEISTDILDRYIIHKNEFIEMLSGMENIIAANKVISSPANKIIVYKLQTALDIIVNHEKRHIEQMKRIISELRVGKRL